MLNVIYLVAAADPLDAVPMLEGEAGKLFGHNVRDILLLAGMAFILGATLFLYAYITRKRRRATIGPTNSRAIFRAEPKEPKEPDESRRYRKRRRRPDHPEFLPRNPTLQETGGLPPLRPEEPPAEPTQ
jgi:hypothetical protein